MRRSCTSLPHDQRGSSAIEFAIIAPVFLTLVFGMIAYAIYFGAAHSLQQLTADAARASVAGITTIERQAIVDTYLERHTSGYLLLDPARLRHTARASTADPEQFEVSLSYDAVDLPIWGLAPFVPLPNPTLRSRSSIRLGGQ